MKATTKARSVFDTDRWECVYCGSTLKLTLDHVIPVSKGGSGSEENLVTACYDCNHGKADREPPPMKHGRFAEGESRKHEATVWHSPNISAVAKEVMKRRKKKFKGWDKLRCGCGELVLVGVRVCPHCSETPLWSKKKVEA